YTQKEFAEKLGMTTVGLAQIIAGKPSYTTLEKIADALEVEIWELLISKGEIVGKSNTASLTCPHCGKSITLKTE
ncbi:helix-turn-helix transcriptional regulator, partial [Bacteroides fragilis]|uniref:helix-turn-helix domain-containing protein n=1 Tax=Bacteroides fragilis TaxID=817 RepID=UPI00187A32B1